MCVYTYVSLRALLCVFAFVCISMGISGPLILCACCSLDVLTTYQFGSVSVHDFTNVLHAVEVGERAFTGKSIALLCRLGMTSEQCQALLKMDDLMQEAHERLRDRLCADDACSSYEVALPAQEAEEDDDILTFAGKKLFVHDFEQGKVSTYKLIGVCCMCCCYGNVRV